MIRAQRSETAEKCAQNSKTVVLRETGSAELDRVFCYRLGVDSPACATIILTQRGKFASEFLVPIAVGPNGAGRVRVRGCVEVMVVMDNVGDNTLYFTMLEAGNVEPVPPIDALEMRVGVDGGIAGILPGPWVDVGGVGWCPPERYTVGLSTAAPVDFRFVDVASNVFAAWTVNGANPPILHPPRLRLQAMASGAPSLTPVGLCAVWR